MRNQLLSLAILVATTTGCATIVRGTSQTVQVVVTYNLPPEVAATDIRLFIGQNEVPVGGGPITVRRSGASLTVKAHCTRQGYQVVVAPTRIKPVLDEDTFSADLILLPLLFPLIVDMVTGAWWDYPDPLNLSVTVTPLHRH